MEFRLSSRALADMAMARPRATGTIKKAGGIWSDLI